jgi:hypothetical protein
MSGEREITHFAKEEGGDIFPASEFVPGETRFNMLRFADGSVFDLRLHEMNGNGWRGKLFPVWSENVMRGDKPAPPQFLWTAEW